jgi:hypothetical protein
MAIQIQYFNMDGEANTFPVTKPIKRKGLTAVYGRDKNDLSFVQFVDSMYDIISNSIVLNTDLVDLERYDLIEVRVADSDDELALPPSYLNLIVKYLPQIITVANNIDSVNEVAKEIRSVERVADNLLYVVAVANIIAEIKEVVSIYNEIKTVAGIDVEGWFEFTSEIRSRPGERVEITLVREGREIIRPVTLDTEEEQGVQGGRHRLSLRGEGEPLRAQGHAEKARPPRGTDPDKKGHHCGGLRSRGGHKGRPGHAVGDDRGDQRFNPGSRRKRKALAGGVYQEIRLCLHDREAVPL